MFISKAILAQTCAGFCGKKCGITMGCGHSIIHLFIYLVRSPSINPNLNKAGLHNLYLIGKGKDICFSNLRKTSIPFNLLQGAVEAHYLQPSFL